MTITTDLTSSGPYVPNGATVTFPFTFQVKDAADVGVEIDAVAVNPDLFTATLNDDGTGSVTFFTAPTGSALYVRTDPDFTQQTTLQNQGPYFQRVIEDMIDRATTKMLWLRERVNMIVPSAFLSPTGRANRFLGWDASGDPIASAGTGADAGLRTDLADDAIGGRLLAFGASNIHSALDDMALPERYGIVDDPTFLVDQTSLFQDWLADAVARRLSPHCPRALRARVNSTLTFDPTVGGLSVKPHLLWGNLWLITSANTGLVIGHEDRPYEYAHIEAPNIQRTAVDWSGSRIDNAAALITHNLQESKLFLKLMRYFTKGHLIRSHAAGWTYNTVYGGSYRDCRFGEVLLNVGNGVSAGSSYINDNKFFGGHVGYSSPSISQTGNVRGTVFAYTAAGERGHNSNIFVGRSYEMLSSVNGWVDNAASTAFAIEIDGCGSFNRWIAARYEEGDDEFMLCNGRAENEAGPNYRAQYAVFNQVDLAFIGGANAIPGIKQVGGAFGNEIKPPRVERTNWNSGPLRGKVWSHGADGLTATKKSARIMPPFFFMETIDENPRRDFPYGESLKTNVHGLQFNSGGVGIRLDTRVHKDWIIKAGTRQGFSGALMVQAFDAAGVRYNGTIADPTYGTDWYVVLENRAFTSNYANAWISGTDGGGQNAHIRVRPEIVELTVAFVKGTNPLVIDSFEVTACPNFSTPLTGTIMPGVSVRDPLGDEAGMRTAYADPDGGTHGFFTDGEIIGSNVAASGTPMGWICTVGGALGDPFAVSTTLAVPGQVIIANGNAYYVRTTGVTAAAGTGPTGTVAGTDYTSGTVVFRYLGPKANFVPLANVP